MPVALLTQQMNRSNIVYYILFFGAGPGNTTTISPVSSLPTRFRWSKATTTTTSSHGNETNKGSRCNTCSKMYYHNHLCTTTITYLSLHTKVDNPLLKEFKQPENCWFHIFRHLRKITDVPFFFHTFNK
ncbi:hypothetical protein Bca4012_009559 [Brassica carinata]